MVLQSQPARLRAWRAVIAGLPLLALGLLAASQLAQLGWAIFAPLGPAPGWSRAAGEPPAVDGAVLRRFDPFYRVTSASQAGALATLGFTLHGISTGGAGPASAILSGTDGAQASYVVGAQVMPGVRLAGVAFDHVVLERAGVQEILALDRAEDDMAAPAAGAPLEPVKATQP